MVPTYTRPGYSITSNAHWAPGYDMPLLPSQPGYSDGAMYPDPNLFRNELIGQVCIHYPNFNRDVGATGSDSFATGASECCSNHSRGAVQPANSDQVAVELSGLLTTRGNNTGDLDSAKIAGHETERPPGPQECQEVLEPRESEGPTSEVAPLVEQCDGATEDEGNAAGVYYPLLGPIFAQWI